MKTPLYSLNRPLPCSVSKLPLEVRGASHSHQEIDQMKRGHGVISHYKFTGVLCINMHNLGYDLNAKYKHTHTPTPRHTHTHSPPPCPPHSWPPSLSYTKQSSMDNKSHWCACAAAEGDRGGFVVDLTACSTFSFYQYISSLLLGGWGLLP